MRLVGRGLVRVCTSEGFVPQDMIPSERSAPTASGDAHQAASSVRRWNSRNPLVNINCLTAAGELYGLD